ncbi:MAG: hypothetical protein GTO29_11720 [Candidatus Latescibacteria bacterium]|nr:hypothetical protein [Candidatus Latescibacterota bacterium]NIO56834.1 hypothetical protein [Candidatus Latescibacterota bacterium]
MKENQLRLRSRFLANMILGMVVVTFSSMFLLPTAVVMSAEKELPLTILKSSREGLQQTPGDAEGVSGSKGKHIQHSDYADKDILNSEMFSKHFSSHIHFVIQFVILHRIS